MFRLEVAMFIIVLLFGILWSVKAQSASKSCDSDECIDNLSSPENFPFHPDTNLQQFVDSMAVALGCKILIKESTISTTLNARPVVKSLFGKRSQRRYVIRINNRDDFDGVKLSDVPIDAQIGLWYHEMMHIKDYQSKSLFGLARRGLQYLSVNGKRIFEHEIDRMVIQNGYGNYLYQWSHFSMVSSNASEEYKSFKSSIYLTPDQIQNELMLRQMQLVLVVQHIH
jgi:hypothetical protein